jgi:hypothetical protein
VSSGTEGASAQEATPAAATATFSTWALSTEQGPAMITISGPPTFTPRTSTTVAAGLKVRPTSL